MKSIGNSEILEWFEHPGMELPTGVEVPGQEQTIALQIEPSDEEKPDIKIDTPDEVKDIKVEVKALELTNSIQNYLKFYSFSPSSDMMNKENLIKKIQGMIEELSNIVGGL